MLTEIATAKSQLPGGGASRRSHSRRAGLTRHRPAGAAFLGALGLMVAYALPGGAYGVTVRQGYAIVVWAFVALGFGCGWLPRTRPSRPILVLLALIALYAAWTVLSLTWTESLERTSAEVARVFAYGGLVLLLVAVLDRRTWRAALLGLGAGAMVICLLALASRLAPGGFPVNGLAQSQGNNRLSYPFGYWNAVGAWAAMAATLALGWSAHDGRALRRAVSLGLVPAAIAVLYLSYSRGGAAGLLVGSLMAVVLARHRITSLAHALTAAATTAGMIAAIRHEPQIASGTGSNGAGVVLGAIIVAMIVCAAAAWGTAAGGLDRVRLGGRVRSVLVLVVAAALAFAAAALGPGLLQRAWRQFRQPVVVTSADPASRLTQLSGNRYALWRAALQAFDARPLAGTGAGTFEFSWDQRGSNAEFVRNAHSLELENLSELGLPGLLLIVGVLGAGAAALADARRGARRRTSAGAAAGGLAAFAVYIAQASVDWLWQSTAVTVFALAVVATGAVRMSRPRPRVRWYGRVAVVMLALGGLATQVPGLLAAAAVTRSQAAQRAGRADQALAWADAAVSAEPWSASAYDQRGLVFESGGQLRPATADFRRATTLEPTNFRHWLLLARVETEAGDFAAAVAAYERAQRLRPHGIAPAVPAGQNG